MQARNRFGRRSARAIRRAHAVRSKAAVRRRIDWAWWPGAPAMPPSQLARRVGIEARSPQRCSCWMCASPRRFFGNSAQARTRHEQVAAVVLREWAAPWESIWHRAPASEPQTGDPALTPLR